MDNITVPKVINRHVYKALVYLHSLKRGFRTREEITLRVRYTMRRNKPVRNIAMVVRRSLSNLTDAGILASTGPNNYCIRSALQPTPEFLALINQNGQGENGDSQNKEFQNGTAQLGQGRSEIEQPQIRPSETRAQRAQIRRSPAVRSSIGDTPRLGVANNSHAINRHLSMARRFSILRFPERKRFQLCSECVSVASRFTRIYRELLRQSGQESTAGNGTNTEQETTGDDSTNNDDNNDNNSDDNNDDTSDDNE